MQKFSWEEILYTDDYFNNILPVLEENKKKLCPEFNNIFKFKELPIEKIKVIIIGQDPYHTVKNSIRVATGLSFSVNKEFVINKGRTAPSLKNIAKCLIKSGYINEIPEHGDLNNWSKQGVLLLNRSLSVLSGSPNCHKKLWNDYTKKIIRYVTKYTENVVICLWGGEAQKIKSCIGKERGHLILEYGHPSPLNTRGRFENCNHFIKINEHIKKHGGKEIEWDWTKKLKQ